MTDMFKLTYHVPPSHLEATKAALFAAGAGKVGQYDQCCWQVLGEGQFRPLDGSQPHTGQPGVLNTQPEYRVEMVCEDKHIRSAIAALVEVHPYETPSYAVWQVNHEYG